MKNKELTKEKLLNAVGEIIAEEGFEKVGVNAVSQKSGISKALIYRYFGSIENLIASYIFQRDYWINFHIELKDRDEIATYLKNMFRQQISQLRDEVVLKRLYRWELSANNPATEELRVKREQNGVFLINKISEMTRNPQKEVASMATILSASISYLILLEELTPTYNGINLQSDEGWEQIAQGIDLIIDLWFQNSNKNL